MSLRLFKRPGSDLWQYSGTVAGYRLRSSTGTKDRKEAQRIASEAEARIYQRGVDRKTLTFPKAVALYLKSGKPERFIWKLEDYWKDYKVTSINAGLIKQAAHELYPGCSGATKNRMVIVPMQAIINHCAEMGLCDHLKMKRFEFETKIKKPVTLEWIAAFTTHATRPDVASLAMFMFATGARISEALTVRWEDLDFQKRTVLIRQTKIGNERVAHLPMDLILMLANLPRDKKPFWRPYTTCIDHWDATI